MKPVGQLIRINSERGVARILNGKIGMLFIVENWVGVDHRCAAVLDYRYPDANAAGGYQCWTIPEDGFEIVRDAPASTPIETRLRLALARLTDSFLEKHGCFPLDNAKWKAAMTEAYALVGQPNTPQREAALTELSSTPATAQTGVSLLATVEVDWDKITNAIIGFVESRCDWASTFIPADDAETAGIVQGLRDQKANIWYSEPRFWRLGGTAVLHYDLATEEEGNDNGRFSMTLAAIIQGLSKMAVVAPRHFADLVAENDDAITHDVFVQCCVFGEIIYG